MPSSRVTPRAAGAALAAVLGALLAAAGLGAFPGPGAGLASLPPSPATLEVRFLDVGQGDAVLVRAPDGRAVLYDGGQDGPALLEHLDRAGVSTLELVIASHNHADHIGGLVLVLERYRPAYIMENGIPHTTRTYERFVRAASAAGSSLLEPTRRQISLGPVRLTVIPPTGDSAAGQNLNSVGLLVEYEGVRVSLLGDSEPEQQRWWLEQHADLFEPVAVHKASHHGSGRGDTRELLDRLRPEIVVVGVGARNPFGHPHARALALYRAVGARVCRTDIHGTVTVTVAASGAFRVDAERRSCLRPTGEET